MVDFQSNLFDPIYDAQGVTALFIQLNGNVLTGTVLDKSFGQVLSRKSRRHPGSKRSQGSISQLRMSTQRPYAIVRNAEVLSFGKVASDLVNTFVQFNGDTFLINSYMYRPTTNGIDDGEVLLILGDLAGAQLPAVMVIGQIDGDGDVAGKLAAWLRSQCVASSNAASVIAAFLRGEVAGDCQFTAMIRAWVAGECEGEGGLTASLAAWLRSAVNGGGSPLGTLPAFLRTVIDGEADADGTLPAWMVGAIGGDGFLIGTLTVGGASDPKARIVVVGTERMTVDGFTRVVV